MPTLAASALAISAMLGVAGCGQSAAARTPSLAAVPLLPSSRVLASVTRCDSGANPYCAVQLVVADRHFRTSADLLKSERSHLAEAGWNPVNADTGDESAAESPGHELRLTYATAALDLKDIDLGWVQRAGRIAHALSRAMFERASALSLMLEAGSS